MSQATDPFDLDVRVATPSAGPAEPASLTITRTILTRVTCRSCTCASCITQCPIGCITMSADE